MFSLLEDKTKAHVEVGAPALRLANVRSQVRGGDAFPFCALAIFVLV